DKVPPPALSLAYLASWRFAPLLQNFRLLSTRVTRRQHNTHGLFLKRHISRIFNRQDAKYAKFPRRCLFAGENIEFVRLGDLGVLGGWTNCEASGKDHGGASAIH
ncbi:MAG: hypothetical protein ACOYOU_20430, partial [Kiritimatiellia bacterium]